MFYDSVLLLYVADVELGISRVVKGVSELRRGQASIEF